MENSFVIRKVCAVYCSGDMKKHFAHLTNCYRDAFYNTVSVGQETDLILVPIIHQYICL